MAGLSVATPSDRAIVMTRSFAAPRELLFAAWTDPELIKRWYGARGWDIVDASIDLRIGGLWRFVWHGPGGSSLAAGGEYRELERPARLVYTESFDEHWYPGEAIVTHEFTSHNGSTTLTTTYLFDSREIRDQVVNSPMARGVDEGYVRLGQLIVELSRP